MQLRFGLAFALAPLLACSASPDATEAPATPSADAGATADAPAPSTGVTFHRDVEPILRQHCQGCHVQGGIAPFPLVTYDDARAQAAMMAAATASKTMPPWGAESTAECKPRFAWRDDLRLTDAQIATIGAWAAAGAPEGDAVPASSGPPPATGTLAGAQSFTPAQPYAPVGTEDKLRCFLLDPGITTTRFMTGSFFVPTNRTVVHHALAFAIPEGATTPAPDAWDCFGGPDVTGARLISAWAPGGVPTEFPTGVALPLQKGTRFVVQVHYHPHENASPEPDATTFQVKFSSAVPEWVVFPELLGNFTNAVGADGTGLLPGPADPPSGPAFAIPANAKGHTETMQFTVPTQVEGYKVSEISLLGVGAHMHLEGVDEKITATRPNPPAGEPAQECLLEEPHWNFDWQRSYQYDAPLDQLPKLRPGDQVQLRCTYDNMLSKPVLLGETTVDEMCLGSFLFMVKASTLL